MSVLLLVAHFALVFNNCLCDAPTWDEIGHLVAGLSHWHTGRFELYPVNPPLTRMLATSCVAPYYAEPIWDGYSTHPNALAHLSIGVRYVGQPPAS